MLAFIFATIFESTEAVAVLAGGYIASYSPPTPLGLVKSNGLITSSEHHSWLTDGFFCTDGNEAVIRTAEKNGTVSQFSDCVQTGPILILNGHIIGRPKRAERGYERLAMSHQEQTFACIDEMNRVSLGVTDKITFVQLIEFLSGPALHCKDAICFTGLDTSGLQVGEKLFGSDEYLFPDVVGVFRRQ